MNVKTIKHNFIATMVALVVVAGFLAYTRPKWDTSQDRTAVFTFNFKPEVTRTGFIVEVRLNGAEVMDDVAKKSPWTGSMFVRPGETVVFEVRRLLFDKTTGDCSIVMGGKPYGPVPLGLFDEKCVVKATAGP